MHIIQFTQGTFLKLFLIYIRVKILQYSRENLNTQMIHYEQVLSNNGVEKLFNRKEALIEQAFGRGSSVLRPVGVRGKRRQQRETGQKAHYGRETV